MALHQDPEFRTSLSSMLLNPDDGSGGNNNMMSSAAPEDDDTFVCCVCGDAAQKQDFFCGTAGGQGCCTACTKTWTIAQIKNGDSLRLNCPCGLKKLRYVDVRKLFGSTSTTTTTPEILFQNPNNQEDKMALELYENALYRHNQNESIRDYNNTITTSDILLLPFCTSRQDVECPECSTVTKIPLGVKSYDCHHQTCPGRGNSGTPAKICVIHQTRYVRSRRRNNSNNIILPHYYEGWLPRVCLKCEEEKDTKDKDAERDVKNVILQEIRNAFVDKCPNCQNVLGEPEDIVHNCMCLRCSHCPMSVCGFCYEFCNAWNETHQHISTSCPKNPRPNNYYAESESAWRQLMKDRRIAILDQILDRHAANNRMSPDQLEEIRQDALGYL